MIQRHLMSDLISWSSSPGRKPLVLRGARQVGKTWLVREFGVQFDHYLEFNLEESPDSVLFDEDFDIQALVTRLFFARDVPKEAADVLIFLDEIHHHPTAIQYLRYFYEKYPTLRVIAAGSQLETALNFEESFPVGRVQYLNLRPVDFSEFTLHVYGETMHSALSEVPTPVHAQERLLKAFHEYTLIGGMPEVVSYYASNQQDITSLKTTYESILGTYVQDIEKYGRNLNLKRVMRHIMYSGFAATASRITFEGFGASTFRSREIHEAFIALERAFVLQLVRPTTSLEIPFLVDLKKSPKLFWFDTGLVNYRNGWQDDLLTLSDLNEKYRGRITEQIVAQEMLTKHHSIFPAFSFWVRDKRGASAEVDFVFAHRGHLVPVEVKSGGAGKLRSLFEFIDRSNITFGIRLYSGALLFQKMKTISGKEFHLLSLPYFAAAQLKDYVDWILARRL